MGLKNILDQILEGGRLFAYFQVFQCILSMLKVKPGCCVEKPCMPFVSTFYNSHFSQLPALPRRNLLRYRADGTPVERRTEEGRSSQVSKAPQTGPNETVDVHADDDWGRTWRREWCRTQCAGFDRDREALHSLVRRQNPRRTWSTQGDSVHSAKEW